MGRHNNQGGTHQQLLYHLPAEVAPALRALSFWVTRTGGLRHRQRLYRPFGLKANTVQFTPGIAILPAVLAEYVVHAVQGTDQNVGKLEAYPTKIGRYWA